MIYKDAVSINLGSKLTQRSLLRQPSYQIHSSKISNYEPLKFLQKKTLISSLVPPDNFVKQQKDQIPKQKSKYLSQIENKKHFFNKNKEKCPGRYSVTVFTKNNKENDLSNFVTSKLQSQSELFEANRKSFQSKLNKISPIPQPNDIFSSKEKTLSYRPQMMKQYRYSHLHHKSQQGNMTYCNMLTNKSENNLQKNGRLSIKKYNNSIKRKKQVGTDFSKNNKDKRSPLQLKKAICQALNRSIADSSLEIRQKQNLLTLLDTLSGLELQNHSQKGSFTQNMQRQQELPKKILNSRLNSSLYDSKNISFNQYESDLCCQFDEHTTDCFCSCKQSCLIFKPISGLMQCKPKLPKWKVCSKPKLSAYCMNSRQKYSIQNDSIREQQQYINFNS